jgi:hypothetical protein
MARNPGGKIERQKLILTSAANMLSRLKSILGLTAASLIDKNWNQKQPE